MHFLQYEIGRPVFLFIVNWSQGFVSLQRGHFFSVMHSSVYRKATSKQIVAHEAVGDDLLIFAM